MLVRKQKRERGRESVFLKHLKQLKFTGAIIGRTSDNWKNKRRTRTESENIEHSQGP